MLRRGVRSLLMLLPLFFGGFVGLEWRCGEDTKRTRTKRLTVNGIPSNGNCIPDDGTLHGALDVVDLKIQACGGG